MLQRVVTGVLAGAVALAAILWHEPWGVFALAIFILVGGCYELTRLSGFEYGLSLPFVLLLTLFLSLADEALYVVTTLGGVAWVFAAVSLLLWKPKQPTQSTGLVVWLILGATCLPLFQIQSVGEGALRPNLLLLALLPLWVGDSLAYFVGKAFGRHKMAPAISPNKTWEGAAANFAGCMLAAWGIGVWLEVPLAASLAVGLSTGVLGQVGDLLQSRLKRQAGVKDSGSLLPGHGGLLDRLDSFLFSAYPSLLSLYLLAPGLFHVKRWPW